MTQEEIQFLKGTKRKEQIFEYLKERNIPINSLEANSIMEGIMWSDEHPNENLVDIDRAARWVENLLVGNLADGVIDSIVRNFIEDMKK